jgi:murein L,D-transpeptidase YafK
MENQMAHPTRQRSTPGRPFAILRLLAALLAGLPATAQNSFLDYQKSFGKVSDVFRRKEDTLRAQFRAKGLGWPARNIYIRSFKYDSELEVWIRDEPTQPYRLFKAYRVCALAGTLGPKRMEGDYQVPEGFYYINDFRPNSTYHLSLGINYPNASDRILSDSLQPGSDIYIHGSCVTTGCIPITDPQIEELYILALHAHNAGQDYIPVHIYPVRYSVPRSVEFLEGVMRENPSIRGFEQRLKRAYEVFEATRRLPVVAVTPAGDYVVM